MRRPLKGVHPRHITSLVVRALLSLRKISCQFTCPLRSAAPFLQMMVAVGFEEPLVQVMTAVLPAFGFSESTFNSTLSGLKRTWRVTLASRGAEVAGLLASHLHTHQQSELATFSQVTKFCLSAFSNQESVIYGNYCQANK